MLPTRIPTRIHQPSSTGGSQSGSNPTRIEPGSRWACKHGYCFCLLTGCPYMHKPLPLLPGHKWSLRRYILIVIGFIFWFSCPSHPSHNIDTPCFATSAPFISCQLGIIFSQDRTTTSGGGGGPQDEIYTVRATYRTSCSAGECIYCTLVWPAPISPPISSFPEFWCPLCWPGFPRTGNFWESVRLLVSFANPLGNFCECRQCNTGWSLVPQSGPLLWHWAILSLIPLGLPLLVVRLSLTIAFAFVSSPS